MQFFEGGPEVPNELIQAQERGETIFVSGAGVSCKVGLPLFRGLVEQVYAALGEEWEPHLAENEGMRLGGQLYAQYDRVLRCLERRIAASDTVRNHGRRERIRSAIRQSLLPPADADLSSHLALLQLSRDAEGRHRLLTTNFDTLFERAWYDQYRFAIKSHSGKEMPPPKVAACEGVLHLHGRLADARPELQLAETDLVLTSAEFGDAYLRVGWASRYIYDLARTCTMVLVGYQAEDPPMRYLLEVLEVDRERYPDLNKVYAFAPCVSGQEALTAALWHAKGIEPILYQGQGADHAALYRTIDEWQRYATDPTSWRREQLRPVLSGVPADADAGATRRCATLLAHGDASQILGELNPDPRWFPVLIENRVFENEQVSPGEWIAARINDPDMIRECAGVNHFDERTRWYVDWAAERERQNLTPLLQKAWQLILTTKQPRRSRFELEDNWFRVSHRIRNGDAGYRARRAVTGVLRAGLSVKKRYSWYQDDTAAERPETLSNLMMLDFECLSHPAPAEILAAWPERLDAEVALFRSLERSLVETLEEAEDVEFLSGYDRVNADVPSVAQHPQNINRSGFYPIVRAVADLWTRIAERDQNTALTLAALWSTSHFLLVRRLWFFTWVSPIRSAREVASAIAQLTDRDFWGISGQVEIMAAIVSRWPDFDADERAALEARMRAGISRDLFPADAFDDEEKWQSIWDDSVYRRLKRLEGEGALSAESTRLLAEISDLHPAWQPGQGDRDDFSTWHESRWGPAGEPDQLEGVSDENLVAEAMRIQHERFLDQRDVWRVFCAADPERALRGLRAEAVRQNWRSEAWRDLIWAASDRDSSELQASIAAVIVDMPNDILDQLLPAVTSWLQKQRSEFPLQPAAEDIGFFRLWDRLADAAYIEGGDEDDNQARSDLDFEALNRPGGVLARCLMDALAALEPRANDGLSDPFRPRFDRIADAPGRQGLLARVLLARSIGYLHQTDPNWVEEKLVTRFSWDHADALAMWRSYSHGRMGSGRLFNVLKPQLEQTFARIEFSDIDLQQLTSNILSIGFSHQRGQAPEYELTNAEIRRLLTIAPSNARRTASWILWRYASNADDGPVNKAERWRTEISPFFQSIWPLTAALRSEGTSENLTYMALECDAAFPEAVDTILDFIIPYRLNTIAHPLRLESAHSELVAAHPEAFVKLLNAILDPAVHPIPNDLAAVLEECVRAKPDLSAHPAYTRIYGLRRMHNA